MANDRTIQERFEEFHLNNPNIYDELCSLAREFKEADGGNVGIGMLWEVLRWKGMMAKTTEKFKLCDNFRSRYARLIMEQEEDLEGVFKLRPLRS